MVKFHMVPIDYNASVYAFTPSRRVTRDVNPSIYKIDLGFIFVSLLLQYTRVDEPRKFINRPCNIV